jgi:hypothetical protein
MKEFECTPAIAGDSQMFASSTDVSKTSKAMYNVDGIEESDNVYHRANAANPARPGFTKEDQKDMYRMGKVQELKVCNMFLFASRSRSECFEDSPNTRSAKLPPSFCIELRCGPDCCLGVSVDVSPIYRSTLSNVTILIFTAQIPKVLQMVVLLACSGLISGHSLDLDLLFCLWRRWLQCEYIVRTSEAILRFQQSNLAQGTHFWRPVPLGVRICTSQISEISLLCYW